jgi:predicted translin family RNA/ssDNA-binding protein
MRRARENFASALREMKRGCAAFYDMHRADTELFRDHFTTARRVSRCMKQRLPV